MKKYLCSNVTQRRSALLLHLNRKTVDRRILLFGRQARENAHRINLKSPPSQVVQFDDMESSIHSKLKPVSILLMVEQGTRRILDLRVASMPCKGPLAKASREKYGRRPDERAQVRDQLFKDMKPYVHECATIKSDQNPAYPRAVRRHFPRAKHVRVKGRKPKDHGQDELKEGFDPIFSFDHTAAMNRANVSPLIRKTWSLSKKQECLEARMLLYADFHNTVLI